MGVEKKPLHGKHGDSLDYKMINHFLITFCVGIGIGIVFFANVL